MLQRFGHTGKEMAVEILESNILVGIIFLWGMRKTLFDEARKRNFQFGINNSQFEMLELNIRARFDLEVKLLVDLGGT